MMINKFILFSFFISIISTSYAALTEESEKGHGKSAPVLLQSENYRHVCQIDKELGTNYQEKYYPVPKVDTKKPDHAPLPSHLQHALKELVEREKKLKTQDAFNYAKATSSEKLPLDQPDFDRVVMIDSKLGTSYSKGYVPVKYEKKRPEPCTLS